MTKSLHLAIVVGLTLLASPGSAQPAPAAVLSTAERDAQHDFDFEFGAWTTEVRLLRNPFAAEPDWAEYRGTSIVRPLMDGRANAVELSVEGPTGRIEGLALRLYNPQARQWSINYAGLRNGLLTPPQFGGFGEDGRGVFYGHDMLDGRAILVRFVIEQVSEDEVHFEQAFSADGGASWEVNWIAIDRRQ